MLCEAKTWIAGWSSLVARRAHNPKVGGSNPPSATIVVLCMYQKPSGVAITKRDSANLWMVKLV